MSTDRHCIASASNVTTMSIGRQRPVLTAGEAAPAQSIARDADEFQAEALTATVVAASLPTAPPVPAAQAAPDVPSAVGPDKTCPWLESAPQAMLLVTGEARLQQANTLACRLFGCAAEEVIGQSIETILPGSKEIWLDLHRRERQPEGTLQVLALQGVRRDGSHFPAEVRALTLEEEGGLLLAAVCDVSEMLQVRLAVAEATRVEQSRLGQELHGAVGQQLMGLSLLIKSLQLRLQRMEVPEAGDADQILQLVREASDEVRALGHGLLPLDPGGDELPFVLEELAAYVNRQGPLRCRFELRGWEPCSDELARHFFRIAQEAVLNASRHSGGTTIVVTLTQRGEERLLEVRDDGLGLPLYQAAARGMGLRIMQHHARSIRSELTLESAAGKGTCVRCLAHEPRRLTPEASAAAAAVHGAALGQWIACILQDEPGPERT